MRRGPVCAVLITMVIASSVALRSGHAGGEHVQPELEDLCELLPEEADRELTEFTQDLGAGRAEFCRALFGPFWQDETGYSFASTVVDVFRPPSDLFTESTSSELLDGYVNRRGLTSDDASGVTDQGYRFSVPDDIWAGETEHSQIFRRGDFFIRVTSNSHEGGSAERAHTIAQIINSKLGRLMEHDLSTVSPTTSSRDPAVRTIMEFLNPEELAETTDSDAEAALLIALQCGVDWIAQVSPELSAATEDFHSYHAWASEPQSEYPGGGKVPAPLSSLRDDWLEAGLETGDAFVTLLLALDLGGAREGVAGVLPSVTMANGVILRLAIDASDGVGDDRSETRALQRFLALLMGQDIRWFAPEGSIADEKCRT